MPLCSSYGIGGEVGSANVAGCWSQPVHTGAAAIVSMVGMAMVVMIVVVAVMSDGTSSGVCLRARASLVPSVEIVYDSFPGDASENRHRHIICANVRNYSQPTENPSRIPLNRPSNRLRVAFQSEIRQQAVRKVPTVWVARDIETLSERPRIVMRNATETKTER